MWLWILRTGTECCRPHRSTHYTIPLWPPLEHLSYWNLPFQNSSVIGYPCWQVCLEIDAHIFKHTYTALFLLPCKAFTVKQTWTHHTHTPVSFRVLHTPGLCSSERLRWDLRLKGHEEDSAHDLPQPLFPSASTSGMVIPIPAGDPSHTHTASTEHTCTHMRATSCPPSINRISHIMPSAFAVIGKVNPRCENDVWAALLRKRQSSRTSTSVGPRCAALSPFEGPLSSPRNPFLPIGKTHLSSLYVTTVYRQEFFSLLLEASEPKPC